MIVAKPTWDDNIRDLINAPPWVAEGRRAEFSRHLASAFQSHCIDMASYISVRNGAEKIYHFMVSQHLLNPATPKDFWPFEVQETFRLWINQGCRKTSDCDFIRTQNIQPPELPIQISKTRLDIASMDQIELDQYRAEIDAAMTAPLPDIQSIWQRFASQHHKWYPMDIRQIPMWYRAFMLHFETETGISIPYWDWTAAWMSDGNSLCPRAPQAFLDEYYVHPETGKELRNPLRYALQNVFGTERQDKNGSRSTMLFAPFKLSPQTVENRSRKLAALQGPLSELIEGSCLNSPSGQRTDGLALFGHLIAQAGEWAGFQMRPTSLSALDPLFLSLCANSDRLLETWLNSMPNLKIQSCAPLHPFIGPTASQMSETCRASWRYTSVAQMAQASRALDYQYGLPEARPYRPSLKNSPLKIDSHLVLENSPSPSSTAPRVLNGLPQHPVN